MKQCSKGKHDVNVLEFSKNAKNKDGLMAWCKPCMASYERERYQNGDRPRKEKNRAITIERARDYIWSVLITSECIDCGNNDPQVLQFDHKDDSSKSFDVGSMHGRAVSTIEREVSKCDVRCANCHMKRTAKQFGFWRIYR